MVWLVIIVLGLLVVWFGREADKYKRQADFWERAYLEKAGNLAALVDLSEECDSAVLSVRKASR